MLKGTERKITENLTAQEEKEIIKETVKRYEDQLQWDTVEKLTSSNVWVGYVEHFISGKTFDVCWETGRETTIEDAKALYNAVINELKELEQAR